LTMFERFTRKIDSAGPCWIFTGCKSRGYGRIGYRGRNHAAHRVAYELFVGPIPDGMSIDHLCRNHSCVRPDHLEPVTHQENVRRGEAGKYNAIKTHCLNGHPFDPDNTYVSRGRRTCRKCARVSKARWKAEHAEARQ